MNPIDEYIKSQPEEVQPRLVHVRNTIREAIPAAEEKISYQMPTFWHPLRGLYRRNLCFGYTSLIRRRKVKKS